MKIKDCKCKCGSNDFFFTNRGNQKGIFCSHCGRWLKWANKDEQNLIMKQEPRWIPVSERLPEEKQAVLVWCPQYQNIYCAYLEKEQWWIFGAFVQIVPNEVIAWMPLPEPFKAESEG